MEQKRARERFIPSCRKISKSGRAQRVWSGLYSSKFGKENQEKQRFKKNA